MKKVFLVLVLSFLLFSCWNNFEDKKEWKMSFEVKKVDNNSVLYLKNKWNKFEVDKSEWSIKNVEFLNNYLIYEWVSTWWMMKKVFDIKKKKVIDKIYFWVFTNDKKYIYSCEESWYWPWNIQFFDIWKAFKRDIWKELNVWVNWIIVKKCEYKNWWINFELFSEKDSKSIWNYIYNLESNKLEKLD